MTLAGKKEETEEEVGETVSTGYKEPPLPFTSVYPTGNQFIAGEAQNTKRHYEKHTAADNGHSNVHLGC